MFLFAHVVSKGWKQQFVKVTCVSLGSNMPEGLGANSNLNKMLCQRVGSKVTCGGLGSNMSEGFGANRNLNPVLCLH